MFINIFFLLVMIAVSVFFGWLTRRSWKATNVFSKWVGSILGGLLSVFVGLVCIAATVGLVKAYSPRTAPVPDLKVAGTPQQIERGKHIADAFCTSCHSANKELPLTGGVDLGKDFPMPLGAFVSSNLTPAGPLKDWSDGEIFRALRNGVDPDGRWLFVMSNFRGRNLSDEDLQALIAYLRSQPAVENETPNPPDQPGLLGLTLLGVGMLPAGQPPITDAIVAPPRGPTAEYGEYILSYQDCRDCHGENLLGGVEGQLAPFGPNLKLVKGWTQEQFISTLRTGVDPFDHKLDPEKMPWKSIGRMDDEELTAMYLYLVDMP
ncbi:Nicotinate dehydrogenase subunit B [Anaerolineales bacterium]|nr:Nicotinate dehydrogenase subunit B [Anaerolineales bacterium]